MSISLARRGVAAVARDPVPSLLATPDRFTSAATSFVTTSVTPTADHLQLMFLGIGDTGGASVQPTLTGNSLTWVQVLFNQQGTGNQALAVYRALGASPTTGGVTVDFGATTTEKLFAWHVQVSNINTGGTNGSAAIAQAAVTGDGTSTGSVALGSTTPGNITMGALVINSSTETNITGFGAAWTELGTRPTGVTSPSLSGAVVWDDTANITFDFTLAGAQVWAAAVFEIAT